MQTIHTRAHIHIVFQEDYNSLSIPEINLSADSLTLWQTHQKAVFQA